MTVLVAIFWAFPIYWALVTIFKPEQDVVRPGIELWPERFTFEAYTFTLVPDQDRHLVSQFHRHFAAR